MPWFIAAGIGAGVAGSAWGASESKKAAKEAQKGETAATREAIERAEESFQVSEQMLAPYAQQEAIASQQMMAQMGLGGGGGGVGGGGYTSGADIRQQRESVQNMINEMLVDETGNAGLDGFRNVNAVNEGAKRVFETLNELQQSGQLPAGYSVPSIEDLNQTATDAVSAFGGVSAAGHAAVQRTGGTGSARGPTEARYSGGAGIEDVLGKYGVGAGVQPGGPGGMVGQPQPVGAPGAPGGPQTAQDIMMRAGTYEDPREDPELAAYLGLTPESMQVGAGYQETPAYAAAREAGMETVEQGAAGAGTLYSGARGEALRDVGQEVEQQYYLDAMNRREAMMGARRGTWETGKTREQSYYNNFMQMLSAMGSPTTATNIEELRHATATGTGTMGLESARNIGQLQLGAAGAQQAAASDVMGGLFKLGSAYIGRNAPAGAS